jgi:hypothetical protein
VSYGSHPELYRSAGMRETDRGDLSSPPLALLLAVMTGGSFLSGLRKSANLAEYPAANETLTSGESPVRPASRCGRLPRPTRWVSMWVSTALSSAGRRWTLADVRAVTQRPIGRSAGTEMPGVNGSQVQILSSRQIKVAR